jgi:hypothetical protein
MSFVFMSGSSAGEGLRDAATGTICSARAVHAAQPFRSLALARIGEGGGTRRRPPPGRALEGPL